MESNGFPYVFSRGGKLEKELKKINCSPSRVGCQIFCVSSTEMSSSLNREIPMSGDHQEKGGGGGQEKWVGGGGGGGGWGGGGGGIWDMRFHASIWKRKMEARASEGVKTLGLPKGKEKSGGR